MEAALEALDSFEYTFGVFFFIVLILASIVALIWVKAHNKRMEEEDEEIRKRN